MIKKFIEELLQGIIGSSLRKQEMNYTDLSQGLRHPLVPSGVLIQKDGNVQIYAGSSSVVADQKHNAVKVDAKDVMLQGSSIYFDPGSIDELIILGRKINKKLFYNESDIITSKQDLSQYSFVTKATWVDQSGQIHNTTPASQILKKEKFTESVEPDSDLLDTVKDLSMILGVELPKVFK